MSFTHPMILKLLQRKNKADIYPVSTVTTLLSSFSLLCLCCLKTMLYKYKLREKFTIKKKQNLSWIRSYTWIHLRVFDKSSNQGRSITFDLLYQAAVVMHPTPFIIFIQVNNTTTISQQIVSHSPRRSKVQFRQGKTNPPTFSLILPQNWAALNEKVNSLETKDSLRLISPVARRRICLQLAQGAVTT